MHSPRQPGTEDGFIIVAVLWILGALATLAVVYTFYVRQGALQSLGYDERIQAQALASSGLELAAYQIGQRANVRPLQGNFDFRQGTATIGVNFTSENSRIDLNFAPKEVLAGLFSSVGADADDASGYADRIIAWRAPLKAGTADADADLYRSSGKDYGPRHGPFQQTNEIGLVAGLPPYLVDKVLPYLTVYSGQPQVNVLSAPAQVLAAVPGLTPERLQSLLSLRVGTPQDVVNAQLGIAANYVTMSASSADRVEVDVRFTSGNQYHSAADILVVDGDTEPYRVLSWRNDILRVDEASSTGMR